MNEIQCYLAQYIPNLLRRETTNVGVVLRCEGTVVGRFFAELIHSDASRSSRKRPTSREVSIDKKVASTRVLFPSIYRQWVEYWRYQIGLGVGGLESALNDDGSNFVLTPTAFISDLKGGTLRSMLDECYRLMVDPTNDVRPDHQPQDPSLYHTIRNEFEKSSILAKTKRQLVPNPIIAHAPVTGRVVPHEVSFVQKSKDLVVMQAVNIRSSQAKKAIGMSAQSTAYMFEDVRAARDDRGIKTIALVKAEISPSEDKTVERAFDILSDAAHEVVNWSDQKQRDSFLNARYLAAYSTI